MVAYFIWARSPKGPEPQIQFDVLGKDWDTSKANCRAYSVHEIPDDLKPVIKEVSGGNFDKAVQELSKRFPPPVISEGSESILEGV